MGRASRHSTQRAIIRGTRQTKHGNGVVMKMGDARLQRTDHDQVQRGQKAVEALNDSLQSALPSCTQTWGAKGSLCCLPPCHTLSPNNTFLVPLAHGLYYGVVESFVEYALRPIKDGEPLPDDVVSKASRAEIGRRAAHVWLCSDFGRMYRCVLSARGTWRMEDWQHFVESISLYIFSGDVLPPKLRKIWDLLRQISVHFARPPVDGAAGAGSADEVGDGAPGAAGTSGEAAGAGRGRAGQGVDGRGTEGRAGARSVSDAARMLRMVGGLYEQYKFPDCRFTYNLHMLVRFGA